MFVIIGYNYYKFVKYTPINLVSKIDEITYTKVILLAILYDLYIRGLTL